MCVFVCKCLLERKQSMQIETGAYSKMHYTYYTKLSMLSEHEQQPHMEIITDTHTHGLIQCTHMCACNVATVPDQVKCRVRMCACVCAHVRVL